MKKSRKVLSLVLALALAFSAIGTVFAVSAASETTYTPTYTDKMTKEDVKDVLNDLDVVVSNFICTSDNLKEVYKVLPTLSAILTVVKNSTFYKTIDPQLFADLPDGEVTADSMKGYLDSHSPVISSGADFVGYVKAIINNLDSENIYNMLSTVSTAPASQALFTPALFEVFEEVDKILKGLGIAPDAPLKEYLGVETYELDPGFGPDYTFYIFRSKDRIDNGGGTTSNDWTRTVANTKTFINAVIDKLLPNTVSGILDILSTVADETNSAHLYSGLTGIMPKVQNLINEAADAIDTGYNDDGDLTPMGELAITLRNTADSLSPIIDTVNALPTETNAAGETILDIDDLLVYLVNDVALPALNIPKLEVLGIKGKSTTAILTIEPFNLANLAAAADSADTFMVLYNYLYQNLAGNTANKEGIQTLLGVVGGMLPAGVADTVVKLLDMSQEDLFAELSYQTGVLSGRVEPTEPTEPGTDEVTTENTTEETTTGEPATGDNSNVDTGDAALAAVAFTGVAAAAAFVLLRKKK